MPPPMFGGPDEPPRVKRTWKETFDGIRHFVSYYRPYKGLAVLDLFAILMQAGLTLLIPMVVFRIFNTQLKAGNLTELAVSCAFLLILAVLIAASEYISMRWGHILGARMESEMRNDMFRHLQKLSFNYFDRTKTGQLLSRISNDLMQLSETAHHAPEDLIVSSLTLIGAFVIMLCLNPLLTMITVLPLPVMLIWGTVFQGRMHAGFRSMREKIGEINRNVENSLQGIREVKSFNNEKHTIERFQHVNDSFLGAKIYAYKVMASFHAGLTFLMQFYSLMFIAAGAILISLNKADLPQLLTFYMYSRYVIMPVMRMLHFTEQFQQASAAFERFREVMHETPDLQDPKKPFEPEIVHGDIEFKDVCFRYPTRTEGWVLDHVSFRIPVGMTVALVGESGAGKSTIASLIPRFYEITEGSLTIDGHEVREYRQTFLHSRIGLVQQAPFLFDASIRENIRFGRLEASDAEIEEAAKMAHVYDFAKDFPDGLDTEVGERGVILSGGQRQRISIARVFLKNPPILIFDEATSALDNESEELIRIAMEKLCAGRTAIIIAHRLSTIKHVQKILCLKNGQLVGYGTHAELISQETYYKRLYEMHSF